MSKMYSVEDRVFKIYGKDYEGLSLENLIPSIHSGYNDPDPIRYLKSFIEEGGKVYAEITGGARKGTVGRINLSPEMLQDCYEEIKGGYYKGKKKRLFPDGLELIFDDRKQVIKLDMDWYKPKGWPAMKITFLPDTTTWAYTTTARPKEETWIPRDFFGNELVKDSLVFFSSNDGINRIGKVQRWTNKRTMWVESLNLPGQCKPQVFTHGVAAAQMILIDAYPDLKSAVTLKKLGG